MRAVAGPANLRARVVQKAFENPRQEEMESCRKLSEKRRKKGGGDLPLHWMARLLRQRGRLPAGLPARCGGRCRLPTPLPSAQPHPTLISISEGHPSFKRPWPEPESTSDVILACSSTFQLETIMESAHRGCHCGFTNEVVLTSKHDVHKASSRHYWWRFRTRLLLVHQVLRANSENAYALQQTASFHASVDPRLAFAARCG